MSELFQPQDPIGATVRADCDIVSGHLVARQRQRRLTTTIALVLACAIGGGVLYAAQPKPYPAHMTAWAFRV
ncbi:MAG TPA: hypothetical protein PK264_06510 [Hyphomicrobiaceae bacterium]|nr:hypothetical protein [Hyphomicrobiaceae bacterium]